jgi:hypothetical protein
LKDDAQLQTRREPNTYNGTVLCSNLAVYQRRGEDWVRSKSWVILDELTRRA